MTKTIREAVGVFDDAPSLEAAIDELQSSGFGRAEISLLADDATIFAKLGHLYDRVQEFEDDPDVPRTAYVSKESLGDAEGGIIGALTYLPAITAAGVVVAAGGPMGAAFIAAALYGGAGALVGTVLALLLGETYANRLEHQIDKGGLILWVRTWDQAHADRAMRILRDNGGHDVHVHDIAALPTGN